jgi:NADP-dependent 3-hydroxy acid dehydrogenase YdfG
MRTVFITGATAGIGRATAVQFDRAGYRVGAYGRNPDALASLREELGPEALVDTLDVRDADAWATRLAELAGRSDGKLDVLVNNAGILSSGKFAEIPLVDQKAIIDINVGGTMTGCHVSHPYLKATKGAQVINVCSASAIYGQAELATYSASKFAIRGLTEALDLEWAGDGIRVSAVWPLFVATDMVANVDTASTRSLGVSLTADDVAKEIVGLAERRSWLPLPLPHGVHYPVGRQAKALFSLMGVTPGWINREINRRATGGH